MNEVRRNFLVASRHAFDLSTIPEKGGDEMRPHLMSLSVMKSCRIRCACVFAAILLPVGELMRGAQAANRIIYISDDKASSWAEGYYRQNPLDGDEFVREKDGMTFREAWRLINADGDELIVISHGHVGNILLEGMTYAGFRRDFDEDDIGTGLGCIAPYELSKVDQHFDHVRVWLSACFSNEVPQGPPGVTMSVADSLKRLFNGPENTVSGRSGTTPIAPIVQWKVGTDQQKLNTLRCFDAAALAADFQGDARIPQWLSSLRYEQHQTLNRDVIQPCRNAGQDVVDVNFSYTRPGGGGNVLLVTDSGPIKEPQLIEADFCGKPVCVPTLSGWGFVAMTLLMMTAVTYTIRKHVSPGTCDGRPTLAQRARD